MASYYQIEGTHQCFPLKSDLYQELEYRHKRDLLGEVIGRRVMYVSSDNDWVPTWLGERTDDFVNHVLEWED